MSYRFGDPALPVRFWNKVVEHPSGCWLWVHPTKRLYAQFWIHGSYQTAHRVSYETFVGAIPPFRHGGPQLDHLCKEKLCVRPDHLELVSALENAARSHEPVRIRLDTGVCMRGHAEWERSSNVRPDTTHRCAECHREHARSQARLIMAAARSLGMHKREYIEAFGSSKYKAMDVLDCAALARLVRR